MELAGNAQSCVLELTQGSESQKADTRGAMRAGPPRSAGFLPLSPQAAVLRLVLLLRAAVPSTIAGC